MKKANAAALGLVALVLIATMIIYFGNNSSLFISSSDISGQGDAMVVFEKSVNTAFESSEISLLSNGFVLQGDSSAWFENGPFPPSQEDFENNFKEAVKKRIIDAAEDLEEETGLIDAQRVRDNIDVQVRHLAIGKVVLDPQNSNAFQLAATTGTYTGDWGQIVFSYEYNNQTGEINVTLVSGEDENGSALRIVSVNFIAATSTLQIVIGGGGGESVQVDIVLDLSDLRCIADVGGIEFLQEDEDLFLLNPLEFRYDFTASCRMFETYSEWNSVEATQMYADIDGSYEAVCGSSCNCELETGFSAGETGLSRQFVMDKINETVAKLNSEDYFGTENSTVSCSYEVVNDAILEFTYQQSIYGGDDSYCRDGGSTFTNTGAKVWDEFSTVIDGQTICYESQEENLPHVTIPRDLVVRPGQEDLLPAQVGDGECMELGVTPLELPENITDDATGAVQIIEVKQPAVGVSVKVTCSDSSNMVIENGVSKPLSATMGLRINVIKTCDYDEIPQPLDFYTECSSTPCTQFAGCTVGEEPHCDFDANDVPACPTGGCTAQRQDCEYGCEMVDSDGDPETPDVEQCSQGIKVIDSYSRTCDPETWQPTECVPEWGECGTTDDVCPPRSTCLPEGTKIWMADGTYKNVEEIKEGDLVESYDVNAKEIKPAKVYFTITGFRTQLYKLIFDDGESLTLTNDHPIYIVRNNESLWASLEPEETRKIDPELSVTKLSLGDKVLSEGGTLLQLVNIEEVPVPQTVYSIGVTETNTYYASGVLVHNKGDDDSGSPPPEDNNPTTPTPSRPPIRSGGGTVNPIDN